VWSAWVACMGKGAVGDYWSTRVDRATKEQKDKKYGSVGVGWLREQKEIKSAGVGSGGKEVSG
jgi:hypothetical protein